MKRTINAHKVALLEPQVLYNVIVSPKGGKIAVEFADGILDMTATEVISSSYFWRVVRQHPSFPLSMTYVIEGMFKQDVVNELFNRVLWDLKDHLDSQGMESNIYKLGLTKYIMKTNNDLYNDICVYASGYIKSIDVLDFIKAAYNPIMVDLRCERDDKYDMNPKNDQLVVTDIIDRAEAVMKSGLYNEDGTQNVLSWLIQLGVIKPDQTLQSILMRGWLVDIDDVIIQHPITNSLLEGMNTVEDSSVQTREGALAIARNITDLGKITYRGRAVTVNALYIRNIVPGDCGSDYHISHVLREEEFETNLGSWHKDGDGVIKQIRANSRDMIGKLIHRRTPLGCITPSPHDVCEICLGGISDSTVPHHGVGQVKSKSFSQSGVQKTMSTKHFLKSMAVKNSSLSPSASGFLIVRGTDVTLDRNIRATKKIVLSIPKNEFRGVEDVLSVDNVGHLTLNSVSAVTVIHMMVYKPAGVKPAIIQVGQDKGKTTLSYALLEYMHNNKERVNLDDGDRVVIDLTDFDKTKELLILPTQKEGLLTFYEGIISLFTHGEDKKRTKDQFNYSYPVNTAYTIYQRLLDVNPISLNVIELLLASFVTEDINESGGRAHIRCAMEEGSVHSNANQSIDRNSLAVKFIHQMQDRTFHKFEHYLITDRLDSDIDTMIDPVGVLAHNQGMSRRDK